MQAAGMVLYHNRTVDLLSIYFFSDLVAIPVTAVSTETAAINAPSNATETKVSLWLLLLLIMMPLTLQT